MHNGLISQALKRQSERPDIHAKPVARPSLGGRSGYGREVVDMVNDLKAHVPDISDRQLSTLLNISRSVVAKMIGDIEAATVEWSPDNNEAQSAAELAALHEHHPGRRYEDDARAKDEPTRPVSYFTAPAFRDTGRPADQSHTIKRPVTLATMPYVAVA